MLLYNIVEKTHALRRIERKAKILYLDANAILKLRKADYVPILTVLRVYLARS